MSKRSLKVTGFTRFFLVMLIVAPLAYIAATYYNGQDGLKDIKELLGIEKPSDSSEEDVNEELNRQDVVPISQSSSEKSLREENARLQEELEFKTKRVEELFRENEELRRQLDALEQTKNKNSANL